MSQIPPRWLTRYLTRLGGRTPNGKPRYRLVHGTERLTLKPVARGGNPGAAVGFELRPKYHPVGYYYVEHWEPPELFGSPEEWERQAVVYDQGLPIRVLGPYPSEGEYEQIDRCYLVGPDGKEEPILPTTGYLDYLVRVHQHARSVGARMLEIMRADPIQRAVQYQRYLGQLQEAEKKAKELERATMLDELDDAGPPSNYEPWVGASGTPASTDDAAPTRAPQEAT